MYQNTEYELHFYNKLFSIQEKQFFIAATIVILEIYGRNG